MKLKTIFLLIVSVLIITAVSLTACEETATHEHSFTNYVSDENASCTEDGTKTAKCDTCNITNTAPDPGSAKGHKDIDADGLCDDCSVQMLEGSNPPADGCEHNYFTSTEEPTCISDGKITYLCVKCQGSYSETLPATGNHSYKDGVCEHCGAEKEGDLPPSGTCLHDYAETSKTAPNCTIDGIVEYSCKLCGNSYSEILYATGHDFNADGICQSCNKTENTESCKHSYKEIIKDTTCTEDGYMIIACDICTYEEKTVLPAIGHSFLSDDGLESEYCLNGCGEKNSGSENPPTVECEHEFTDSSYIVVSEPTCTEAGRYIAICYKCKMEVTGVIPVINHTDSDSDGICDYCKYGESEIPSECEHNYECTAVTNSTCAEYGVAVYTCYNCGESYEEILPLADHTFEIDGKILEYCYFCKEPNPDLGEDTHTHSFSEDWSYDENFHWHEATCGCDLTSDEEKHIFTTADGLAYAACIVCGYQGGESEIPSECEHNYECTAVTNSTCTEYGVAVYTCYNCGKSYEEILPLADHTFEIDGKILEYCYFCKEPNPDLGEDTHTHSFSEDWSYDESYHWHKAICGCDLRGEEAEHSFVISDEELAEGLPATCEVCGYKLEANTDVAVSYIYDSETLYVTFYTNGILEYVMYSTADGLVWRYTGEGEWYEDASCGIVYAYIDNSEMVFALAEDRSLILIEDENTCEHKLYEAERCDPTCTNEGYYVLCCAICKEYSETVIIGMLDHEYGEDGVCIYCYSTEEGSDDQKPSYIPDGAVKYGNSYYLIVRNDYITRQEAKAACEAMGGQLASITSAEEQAFIESINTSALCLWIGGYRDDDGEWKWISGEAWDYTNWGDGEPNNSDAVVSNERYVTIWPYLWNDLANDNTIEQYGYICEWNLGISTDIPSTDDTDEENSGTVKDETSDSASDGNDSTGSETVDGDTSSDYCDKSEAEVSESTNTAAESEAEEEAESANAADFAAGITAV